MQTSNTDTFGTGLTCHVGAILGPCWGHVGGQYSSIFSRIVYLKIEFSSQSREMLLFLTTNMAAVTSHANQLELCGVFHQNFKSKNSSLSINDHFKSRDMKPSWLSGQFSPLYEYRYATNICFRICKVLTTQGYEENFGKFSAVVGLF